MPQVTLPVADSAIVKPSYFTVVDVDLITALLLDVDERNETDVLATPRRGLRNTHVARAHPVRASRKPIGA